MNKLTSLMDPFVLLGSAPVELSFLLHKKKLQREHRQECYSLVQKIFGRGPILEGDFILINFFALVFFLSLKKFSQNKLSPKSFRNGL
jgi:hypothetical protein